MKKMRSMERTLTPEETRALEMLKKEFNKAKRSGSVDSYDSYVKGFMVAMEYVRYQMQSVPSLDFLESLDDILK